MPTPRLVSRRHFTVVSRVRDTSISSPHMRNTTITTHLLLRSSVTTLLLGASYFNLLPTLLRFTSVFALIFLTLVSFL